MKNQSQSILSIMSGAYKRAGQAANNRLPIEHLIVATFGLDELDFIAVRILDKGNNSSAVFHRACFTDNVAAIVFDFVTSGIGIFYLNGNMAVPVAQIVGRGIPVIGELDNSAFAFLLITDKGQSKATIRIFFLA